MSNLVTSSDMYEVAMYLEFGFNIERIEVITENRREVCQFTISGENIQQTQLDYFNGRISVNLLDFRRCYMRVHSLIGSAKKEAKKGVLQ